LIRVRSPDGQPPFAASGERGRRRDSSRAATDGGSTVTPRAAARTARNSSSRGASLSRWPIAPAPTAGSTSESVVVHDYEPQRFHGATSITGTVTLSAVPPSGGDSIFTEPDRAL
jgi:hypothetical protein